MDIVYSINKVPIRLTEERWFHITEGHSEMAGYYYTVLECIEAPDVIYKGINEEFIAVKEIEKGKFAAIVYKELSEVDGFIITSFLTKRIKQFERREKIWEKPI